MRFRIQASSDVHPRQAGKVIWKTAWHSWKRSSRNRGGEAGALRRFENSACIPWLPDSPAGDADDLLDCRSPSVKSSGSSSFDCSVSQLLALRLCLHPCLSDASIAAAADMALVAKHLMLLATVRVRDESVPALFASTRDRCGEAYLSGVRGGEATSSTLVQRC